MSKNLPFKRSFDKFIYSRAIDSCDDRIMSDKDYISGSKEIDKLEKRLQMLLSDKEWELYMKCTEEISAQTVIAMVHSYRQGLQDGPSLTNELPFISKGGR